MREVLRSTDPDTAQGRAMLRTLGPDAQALLLHRLSKERWRAAGWVLPGWVASLLVALAIGFPLATWFYGPAELWVPVAGAAAVVALSVYVQLRRIALQAARRFTLATEHPRAWLMAAVLVRRCPHAGAYLRAVHTRRAQLFLADILAIESLADIVARNQVDTWSFHVLRGTEVLCGRPPLEVHPYARAER